MTVVLPPPEGPTSAIVSPGCTVNESDCKVERNIKKEPKTENN